MFLQAGELYQYLSDYLFGVRDIGPFGLSCGWQNEQVPLYLRERQSPFIVCRRPGNPEELAPRADAEPYLVIPPGFGNNDSG
jgi:hypothetical protein